MQEFHTETFNVGVHIFNHFTPTYNTVKGPLVSLRLHFSMHPDALLIVCLLSHMGDMADVHACICLIITSES